MDNTDIQYAIIRAAYAAWDAGGPQEVEGHSIVVIPDTAKGAIDAYLQAQGQLLEEGVLPRFWIEHDGRRAEIAWFVKPPITAPRE